MSPRLAGLFERLFDDGRQLRGAAATGMETCIGSGASLNARSRPPQSLGTRRRTAEGPVAARWHF